MRKTTLLTAALFLVGLLAAAPSFGSKGRFFAHGNSKLGKNTLTVKQARLAVANAINLKLGATGKAMRIMVKPEQIQISLKQTKDGKVLFAAKLRADGRTRAAKVFKTEAVFRGLLDVQLKNPSYDAVRDAAYLLAKSEPGRWGKGSAQDKRNFIDAKRALTLDLEMGNRVRFFEGNAAGKFNDVAKNLE